MGRIKKSTLSAIRKIYQEVVEEPRPRFRDSDDIDGGKYDEQSLKDALDRALKKLREDGGREEGR